MNPTTGRPHRDPTGESTASGGFEAVGALGVDASPAGHSCHVPGYSGKVGGVCSPRHGEGEATPQTGTHDSPAVLDRLKEPPTQGQARYFPNDLLTVDEGARFAKCHSETIRRGYWSGQLRTVPFGERRRRIVFRDLVDWIERGAKTKP